MLSYQTYVHLENWRTFLTQIIDDFPAVWNYGKLSAKFFLSSVKVIDTVGFLSFFKSFTRTTIKIPLKVIQKYEKATGVKINVEKTEGLWLGSWQKRTDRPFNRLEK